MVKYNTFDTAQQWAVGSGLTLTWMFQCPLLLNGLQAWVAQSAPSHISANQTKAGVGTVPTHCPLLTAHCSLPETPTQTCHIGPDRALLLHSPSRLH